MRAKAGYSVRASVVFWTAALSLVLPLGASAATHPPVASTGGTTGSTWGVALKVPGSGALNSRGGARVNSVSCSVPANCSAGGYYTGSTEQAFVVSEVNGSWRLAEPVPGLSALGSGPSSVVSVSCSSPGNCAAGGFYTSASGQQVFVVNQVKSIWGKAREIPGTGFLTGGRGAGLASVSCGAAGNCTAGGDYADSSGNSQAFVSDEVNGTWQLAFQLPGTPVLSAGGPVNLGSLSCASAANCTAAGSYTNGRNNEAFVASEAGGTSHDAA